MRAWLLLAFAACGRIEFDDTFPVQGPACGPAYQAFDGLTSKYRLGTVALTWHEAEAECEADGGHLVVIDDAVEGAWVLSQAPLMVGPGELWIGASDHAEEGTFRSVTGQVAGYVNWASSEPNNSGGEDCVHLKGDARWNDATCSYRIIYMCECDRIPLSGASYCDTQHDPDNCGECGTTCPGGACTNQQCD